MIHEGELLWTPSADWIANANITKYSRWLGERRGLSFPD
jgi:acetoacetyl-CoA synthetase